MHSFRQHFIKSLQLTESPMRTGFSYADYLDNDAANCEEARRIQTDFDVVETITADPATFDLHRDGSGDTLMDYWLTPQPFVACYYIFTPKSDGGIQSGGVWNHKRYKATARGLFFDYYLQNYPYVQSDKLHSTQGERFWKRLIAWASDKGHRITVCTRNENECDIDDADAFWGNLPEFTDYTFKIYSTTS